MKSTNVFRFTSTGVNITTGVASASATLPNNAAGTKRYYRLACTVACHVRYGGGAQTAVATDLMLTPNAPLNIDATSCDTIAAIQEGSAGLLNITPIES